MTRFHDDGDEMPRTATLDERSIEAIIAGRSGVEHPMLSAFIADVRLLGAGPVPQPSSALSSIFLHGVSTEKGDLRATAASNVDGPAPQVAGLPKWRRKIMVVKHFIAGLSVVGKLTFGIGAAAAASGGAGSAGVLPDPLQHQFAETFDGIAPFELDDPGAGDDGTAPGTPGNGKELDEVESAPAPVVVTATTATTATAATTTPATTAAVVGTTAAPPQPPTTGPAPAGSPPAGFPGTGPSESTSTSTPTPETGPATTATTAPPAGVTSTTAAPWTTPTTSPAPPPAGSAESMSLVCKRNDGWISMNCYWSPLGNPATAQHRLHKTGPGGAESMTIWGGPSITSWVDIHVEAGQTYTYRIEAIDASGLALGSSATITVTVQPLTP